MRFAGLFVVLACAFFKCNAQQSVSEWLMKEMRYMKADAESNVKTAQYLLNRINDAYRRAMQYSGGTRPREGYQRAYSTPPIRPAVKPTKPPPIRGPQSMYPRDCTDALSRNNRGGWRKIDPDGENSGADPFYVRCEMDGRSATTEIGLYSEWMQRFDGRQSCINGRDMGISGSNVYCAKTETLIPYKPTPQQLRAALLVSGNCSQTVTWSCHGNSILYLNPGTNRMLAYGQKLQQSNYFSQGACECAENRGCRQPDLHCHCGSNMNDIWMRDTITITDKSMLPVSELVLGDMAGARDRAMVSVSPITCVS